MNIMDYISYININEMARVNDLSTFKYDVYLNGGNPKHGGRVEHGEPHFHFYDNKVSGRISLSVKIPTIEEWENNKILIITESNSSSFLNWKGLKKERKDLIKWLDEYSHIIPKLKNIQYIRLEWNILNIDNKNVKQMKLK